MQMPVQFPPLAEPQMQFQSIDDDTEECEDLDFPLPLETLASFGMPAHSRPGSQWKGEQRVPLDDPDILEYLSPDRGFSSDRHDFM